MEELGWKQMQDRDHKGVGPGRMAWHRYEDAWTVQYVCTICIIETPHRGGTSPRRQSQCTTFAWNSCCRMWHLLKFGIHFLLDVCRPMFCDGMQTRLESILLPRDSS